MIHLNKLNAEERKKIVDSYDIFFSDIDGVITGVGDVLPGSAETLIYLKSKGKCVKLFTNNCFFSRQSITENLKQALPFITRDDIISAKLLAVEYFKKLKGTGKKVYVIGSQGLVSGLKNEGIEVLEETDGVIQQYSDIRSMKLEDNVGAVLLGADFSFSYTKLMKMMNYLARDDVEFATTHFDKFMHGSGDIKYIPGAGCIAEVVKAVIGKEATVIGKPGKFSQEYIKRIIPPGSRALFIGDSLGTDIELGNSSGLSTLLVLTGVSTLHDAEQARDRGDKLKTPTYVAKSLKDLVDFTQ